MNKKFYRSKKFWTALVTAVAASTAYFHSADLARLITFVGMTLIAGFAMADFGKESGE